MLLPVILQKLSCLPFLFGSIIVVMAALQEVTRACGDEQKAPPVEEEGQQGKRRFMRPVLLSIRFLCDLH